MFCALLSIRGERLITADERVRVRAALAAADAARIEEYSLPHCHIARLNAAALDAYSGLWGDGDMSASVLAGEPLIAEVPDLKADHLRIVEDLRSGAGGALAEAAGVFCGLLVQEGGDGAQASAVTDKLGIRPLYYAVAGDLVAISSALPAIAALGLARGSSDLLGVAESVALGFAVADRTYLAGVSALRPGHVVAFPQQGPVTRRYWDWSGIETQPGDPEEAARDAHALFLRAVSRRARDDRVAVAGLSGGLDSRCVVAALRQLDRDVVCLNRSDKSAKDYVYGKQVADALGCAFHHLPLDGDSWFRKFLAGYIRENDFRTRWGVERPGALWSGDGGSVGMGTVYLDDGMVSLAREGREREAARRLLSVNRWGLPLGILKPAVARELTTALEDSVVRELDGINCEDRGQALLLFLMLNDQHRHMEDVYHMLNRWGLEYQMPFFDGDFLARVFSVSLDERLRHRFYNRWLKRFQPAVYQTNWQVYPGHEGGAFEEPAGLLDQWRDRPGKAGMRQRYAPVSKLFGRVNKTNPDYPVSRSRLLAAAALHVAGVRDYEYAFGAAERFARYYS